MNGATPLIKAPGFSFAYDCHSGTLLSSCFWLCEFERGSTNQQFAIGGFYEMQPARFDAPEDVAGGSVRQGGGFVRRQHQDLRRTLVTPGEDLVTPPAYRRALEGLFRDNQLFLFCRCQIGRAH